MKFFVYGRLKSTERKAWMIPFSKSKEIKLKGCKLVVRPDGAAAMVAGQYPDYVVGEVREARWAVGLLGWLLLKLLDINEGVKYGVYKRVTIDNNIYVYINTLKLPDTCKVIKKWTEGC